MINNSKFSERLKKIMEHHQLSSAAFADEIEVQRSTISHLLSGRNKPSLDFVLKVLSRFKTVELYWLMNGKGSFPLKKTPTSFKSPASKTLVQNAITHKNTLDKEIDKVIIFYKDGTFESYNK